MVSPIRDRLFPPFLFETRRLRDAFLQLQTSLDNISKTNFTKDLPRQKDAYRDPRVFCTRLRIAQSIKIRNLSRPHDYSTRTDLIRFLFPYNSISVLRRGQRLALVAQDRGCQRAKSLPPVCPTTQHQCLLRKKLLALRDYHVSLIVCFVIILTHRTVARVKKIIAQDEDISQCSNAAAFAIAIATVSPDVDLTRGVLTRS